MLFPKWHNFDACYSWLSLPKCRAARGVSPQQTRDIYPMLKQCWSTVYNASPTLVQHWVDVSCFLGRNATYIYTFSSLNFFLGLMKYIHKCFRSGDLGPLYWPRSVTLPQNSGPKLQKCWSRSPCPSWSWAEITSTPTQYDCVNMSAIRTTTAESCRRNSSSTAGPAATMLSQH